MDVQKQIDFWRISGDEDLAAAESLLEKGHLRHCLFLAHLAIEKMLKAHVTRQTEDIPPRTHNLVRLAEIAGLKLEPQHEEFLREFGVYQLEGRYPDSEQVPLDFEYRPGQNLKSQGAVKMVEDAVVVAVKRYLAALQAVGIHARRAVLFGSYARGAVTDDSDVDLLVIVPFEGRNVDQSVEIRMKLQPQFPVDLLVRTPEKVRQRIEMGDGFMREIVEEGKVLYEADRC